MSFAQSSHTPDPAMTLGKAAINAGEKLGLNATQVGRIVGKDRTTISRSGIKPDTPQGKLALLIVRLYRSLFALTGGNTTQIQHWMDTRITTLGGIPREMTADVVGLVHLVEYLDAMRGSH